MSRSIRRPRRLRRLMIVALVLSQSVTVSAQEATPSTDEVPAAASVDATTGAIETESKTSSNVRSQIGGMSGRVQYVGPDTYILLDAEGRPQPVPGMTYEDFLAAWKKSQQPSQANRQPRFTIEHVHIEGQAQDGRAELQFDATVQLLTDEAVEVPLGLVGAILQGQPRFGPADQEQGRDDDEAVDPSNRDAVEGPPVGEYLNYEPHHGGFVAHLAGRAGERRVVSLNLLVPLSRDGPETTLPLSCPRALSSNMTLTVTAQIIDANVTSGTLVAYEPTAENGTRMKVAGAIGQFRLTWRTGDSGAGELATVLSAAGAVHVAVDGRSVRSNARLTVQSYGGSFDRFRVRLPPGAKLLREPSTDADAQRLAYRITIEDTPAGGDGDVAEPPVPRADVRQTVLVEFPEKQRGPVAIDLSTEQPIGLEGRASPVELAGFEVIGAVRQFGDIALEVADDWQVRWELGTNVRQVDPSELDASMQLSALLAAFQYDGQPWSLGVRIAARQTRIHVTPKYELEFLADEARLTVNLSYQVFGARAFELKMRMEGWGDPLESGGVVDQEHTLLAPDGILVLPLAQGSPRRGEITFAVRRALRGSAIKLPLPVPLADSVGSGELIVRGAADVELRPDSAKSTALAPIPATVATDSDGGSNGAGLRYRTVLPEAVFVAERVSRPREVSAKVSARINMAQSDARIEERVDYVVRYGPIKELVLEVPSDFPHDDGQTEVVLLSSAAGSDEQQSETEMSLNFAAAAADEQSRLTGSARQLRVLLPQPRFGQFAIQIRYTFRRSTEATARGSWQLPLARPADGRTADLRVMVQAPRNFAMALDRSNDDLSWGISSSVPERTGSELTHEFVAARPEIVLPLAVGISDVNVPSATIVERVWLQTWLSADIRQDRAAFHFRTTGSQATVELPPRMSSDEIEVLVDGTPAEVLSRAAGRISVRLTESAAKTDGETDRNGAAHTLELRFRQLLRPALVTRHRLTPPQLVGTTTLSQVYWQIVVPGDQHVIRSPDRMTSASRWQWLGSFWGRRPVLAQPDLEKWAGASIQPAPAAAHNEYLYTGLAPVLSIDLITAPRWLIVLLGSSAVLMVMLAWLYLPSRQRARQTWLVVAAACLIAGLAVVFPVPAMLIAQASALGVIVAVLSVVIARLMARPTRWPVALSAGSSQRQITPRADSILMPPVVAAASTAPTVPLRVPDSER